MLKNKEEMLQKKTWAVAGVTAKKDKFGYKIWKILKENNYETYGINPNYDEIEGDKIYHSVKDLPKKIEVLDMVVPPKIAISTLDEAKEADIEYIWFQPGTYNDEVIEKAKELGFKILYDDCVYKELRKNG
ncbi:CoA-binding protein [Tissierella pigra]|uniref:CoA-binding protein n=1 Tax=Tissierella pigra TaxID=2607614 RepID=A0A6N7XZX9_9FIRM|nr:CoA-binding protein [Tissierella pigra]MBU5427055.1 CoA-binding protein [Tissierella pigra]MSU01788.1 CoA-binding protein [Tissierella pigra]